LQELARNYGGREEVMVRPGGGGKRPGPVKMHLKPDRTTFYPVAEKCKIPLAFPFETVNLRLSDR